MKQSLAATKFLPRRSGLLIALLLVLTACIRLPRNETAYPTAATPLSASTIDLNTASAAQLERLPGVGPVLATRIVTYRNEHGRFRRAEHLMMVRGISDQKFRELRSLVKVE